MLKISVLIEENVPGGISKPVVKKQSEIMLRLSFQRPSSVFRDRVQTSSARALPIIMRIHWKRDIIMCILQNNVYSPMSQCLTGSGCSKDQENYD